MNHQAATTGDTALEADPEGQRMVYSKMLGLGVPGADAKKRKKKKRKPTIKDQLKSKGMTAKLFGTDNS